MLLATMVQNDRGIASCCEVRNMIEGLKWIERVGSGNTDLGDSKLVLRACVYPKSKPAIHQDEGINCL